MSQVEKILEALDALQESERSGDVFQPVVGLPQAEWKLEIEEWNRLGVLIRRLELTDRREIPWDLPRQIGILKSKLTYLDGDFRLVEQDLPKEAAILRNTASQKAEGSVTYFEIALRQAGWLSLVCYRVEKSGMPRTVAAANLSRETFIRLLSDLESLVI
ncbi:MAG: hypothetical protein AB1898_18160 [Acidobacteriota bacterium]